MSPPFMQKEMRRDTPLDTHSTPFWLLAEMGVIALLVMATLIVHIFSNGTNNLLSSEAGLWRNTLRHERSLAFVVLGL